MPLPARSHKFPLRAALAFFVFFMANCQDGVAATPRQEDAPAPASPLAIPIQVNGRHAVIDGSGKLRLPFENEYNLLFPADYRDAVLAASDNGWSLIQADGKSVIKANFSNTIDRLTPGYFWFEDKDKLGIIDTRGKVIQPPRYDELYYAGNREFIIYAVNGKSGLMSAKGEPITKAVYDEINDPSSYADYGELVMAKRGSENWLINPRAGTQEKVPYSEIIIDSTDAVYRKVSDAKGKKGLIDAQGKLVIPMEYTSLGDASEGLISFEKDYAAPCGYLDLRGKVVIEAKYSDCRAFGKKGAFVKERDAETGETRQYGLLDRQGAWVVEPKYANAYEAGAGLAWWKYAPGLAAIGTGKIFNPRFGLFDTDRGVEIIAPKYAMLAVLTDRLLAFSMADAPRISISTPLAADSLPSVGLLDYSEKVLLKPEKFTQITLEQSGKFLIAIAQGKQALIDLNGKQIVAPEWPKLEVNTLLNVIFAYDKWGKSGDSIDVLRAAYDFNGKPLFTVGMVPCDADGIFAEVLQDGNGKTLWPQDVTPYCQEEEE
jgi:hypothetical protein